MCVTVVVFEFSNAHEGNDAAYTLLLSFEEEIDELSMIIKIDLLILFSCRIKCPNMALYVRQILILLLGAYMVLILLQGVLLEALALVLVFF